MAHTRELRLRFSSNAGQATYPAGAKFGPRTMRDFEFVWIIEGNVTWYCNGQPYAAPPGSIVLSRPGITEMYDWDCERQTRHAFFHFVIIDPGNQLPPEAQWPLVQQMPEGDIIRPLFRHVGWLLEAKKPEWEELCQHAGRQLLMSFVLRAFHTRAEGTSELSDPVTRALGYLRRYWGGGPLRNPTLQELAAAAMVSPEHLCRLFRRELGCGAMEALRLLRVDHAASLLARTNLAIKDISAQAGFENQFHFSRCFRQAYGVPPKLFRQRTAQGVPPPRVRLQQLVRVRKFIWEDEPKGTSGTSKA